MRTAGLAVDGSPDPGGTETTLRSDAAGYRPGRANRPAVVGAILCLHCLALAALLWLDAIPTARQLEAPLVVELLPLPSEPAPIKLPTVRDPRPSEPRPTPVVSPIPIVRTAATSPTVKTVESAPPPSPPARPDPSPPAPPRAPAPADLSTRLLSAAPPRYPEESRRRREQGVVVLSVTVAEDGGVRSAVVAESSGSERLDRAALGAVRRWRWSPTMVGGVAVEVQGMVRIPFELRN